MRSSDTYEYMRTAGISAGKIEPYPFGFNPTFHRYRLDEPAHWKKPRTIFVCSMADLFGAWVPDEWIAEVFKACEAAPRHRYLFLTKNPGRYCELERTGLMPHGENFWFGATFDHSNWPGADGAHEIPGRPATYSIQGKMVHDAGDYYFPHYPEKNRFIRQTKESINGREPKHYTAAQMLAWYNKLHTDSAEYKMWGNGIALPCAAFVLGGVAEEIGR